MREILVSKRIYKVARPAWLHTLEVDSWSSSYTDEVIAGLLCDGNASSAVRALDIAVHDGLENTTAAMLARLPNLQALTLSFRHPWGSKDVQYPVSAFFLRQLARLPPLRPLNLPNPVCFKADLSVSGPRIQRVTTPVASVTSDFCAFLRWTGVKKLVISLRRDAERMCRLGDLPWTSLQQLVVKYEKHSKEAFNQKLITYLGAQVRLACITRGHGMGCSSRAYMGFLPVTAE